MQADIDVVVSQPNSADDNIADPEEAELNAEDGETPVSSTLRYLGNIVAWIKATDALLRNKAVSGSAGQLCLRLVDTPPAPAPTTMDSVWDLFCSAAAKVVLRYDEETAFLEWRNMWQRRLVAPIPPFSTSDSTTKAANPRFSGTIHCEAALMSAVASKQLKGLDVCFIHFDAVSICLLYISLITSGIYSGWAPSIARYRSG